MAKQKHGSGKNSKANREGENDPLVGSTQKYSMPGSTEKENQKEPEQGTRALLWQGRETSSEQRLCCTKSWKEGWDQQFFLVVTS